MFLVFALFNHVVCLLTGSPDGGEEEVAVEFHAADATEAEQIAIGSEEGEAVAVAAMFDCFQVVFDTHCCFSNVIKPLFFVSFFFF